MPSGSLALVLHAHLPYVRHPEYPEFLEEDWLFEAITETYVPLLQVMGGLVRDGVEFKFTMSLTPPLCAMLRDPLLQERYVRHIERLVELTGKEVMRTEGKGQVHDLAWMYHNRFVECRKLYVETWNCNLVAQFAEFQRKGCLEIITCGATHGFLPLMEDFPDAIRAQILIARDDYRDCFGQDPLGIWLPECAYAAGVEAALVEADIKWFVVDSHGLMFGNPRPRHAIFAPVYTPSGPAAFARDRESSKQVWSAEQGYPGDPAYRDFYRDIGFDLSHKYLAPYLPPDGVRKFTGVKYHRITGAGQEKDLYNREGAMAAADSHATHFMQSRAAQIDELAGAMSNPPLVVSPFDAELFGHWWFEGPEFLDLFIRKAVYDQDAFKLTTPAVYLAENPTQQVSRPSPSSWGNMGYWEVWLDESNSWIYPHLHSAAKRMCEIARKYDASATLTERDERMLRQLARELLLAQSSDWAFLMKTGTAKHYAEKRSKDHILRFNRLYDQFTKDEVDEDFLTNCEWRDNIFPNLNWRYYAGEA